MAHDLLSIARVAELIDEGWWLLLDDGDDLCPGCAKEERQQLLESAATAIETGHCDGWVVVGCMTDDAPELQCCNCDRCENFEEEDEDEPLDQDP